MPRYNPYDLQLQITRMFTEGQEFFATTKVQDWLRYMQQDPAEFLISFQKQPGVPGSNLPYRIHVELRRKDGQPVDPWLLQQLQQA